MAAFPGVNGGGTGCRAAIPLLQDGNPLSVAFVGGLGPSFAARLVGRWPLVQARGSGLGGAQGMARHGRN
ncbi:MAG: hypothetical protein U1D35_09780 [Paracoccaceae bacterium]|nr:hypothetical protein [Paracoccaceae bacterium]